jgi:DNA-binding PadR family transcriptional regulator
MSSRDPSSFLPLPHMALHVLLVLMEEERHGWAIVRRIEERTGGVWSPSAGSLYLSMTRLEEQGLIEDAEPPAPDVDRRRRYYRVTVLGRGVLDLELCRLSSLLGWAEGLRPS